MALGRVGLERAVDQWHLDIDIHLTCALRRLSLERTTGIGGRRRYDACWGRYGHIPFLYIFLRGIGSRTNLYTPTVFSSNFSVDRQI